MSPNRQRHLACALLIFSVIGLFHISFFYHVLNRAKPDSPPSHATGRPQHQRLERMYQAPKTPKVKPVSVNPVFSTSNTKPQLQDQAVCIEKLDREVTVSYQECTDEEQVFSKYAQFQQDDPLLLEWVRRKVLEVPKLAPYNLTPLVKQIGKDEFQTKQYLVIQHLLKNKRNGVFVEAGANDGEEISNTVRLETEFGWSGLLVEPDPAAYSKLKKKNRKAFSANVCLSPTDKIQKMKFTVNKQFSTLSKISEIGDEVGWNWKNKGTETISCVPFYTLIRAAGITQIDFFSLDIEGAELEVLETIPFDKIPILTMTVEYDKIADDPVKDARLQKLMTDNGFVHIMNYTAPMAADYVYAHKSILDRNYN